MFMYKLIYVLGVFWAVGCAMLLMAYCAAWLFGHILRPMFPGG